MKMSPESIIQSKPRLKYIDIAKGILICCLLWGHMMIFARMDGLADPVMDVIQESIYLYNGFFMQTFFVITGFCSSFNKRFPVFLWGNVKSLIIPSLLLVIISNYAQDLFLDRSISIRPISELSKWFTVGGPWFIISMFWGKILYWPIVKIPVRWQLLVIICLYLAGLALKIADVIPNYWYHRHVLLMMPYLFIGYYCKTHQDKLNCWLKPLAIFGFFSIVSQFVISQFSASFYIPTHDFNISIGRNFCLHIVNAITGSAFVLWIAKIIGKNNYLEVMGKGTLLVYLWNGLINRLVLNILPSPVWYPDSLLVCGIYHMVVYVSLLIIFYFLIRLIYDRKSLSWLVGKW